MKKFAGSYAHRSPATVFVTLECTLNSTTREGFITLSESNTACGSVE